ncbi:MAG: hypothetical protein IJ002_04000 [Clostridia bacterium]|nr:hypothetical protein [Clostridia bacterium]
MQKRNVLIADEGMVLTDGENYGRVIYLAEDADAGAYREITQAEYDAIMAESEETTL